jgi:hypothetical protein
MYMKVSNKIWLEPMLFNVVVSLLDMFLLYNMSHPRNKYIGFPYCGSLLNILVLYNVVPLLVGTTLWKIYMLIKGRVTQ